MALTNNTVQFSKAYLNFVEDLMKLTRQDLAIVIDNCLVEAFEAQLAHIDASLVNPNYKSEVSSHVFLIMVLNANTCQFISTTFEIISKWM